MINIERISFVTNREDSIRPRRLWHFIFIVNASCIFRSYAAKVYSEPFISDSYNAFC